MKCHYSWSRIFKSLALLLSVPAVMHAQSVRLAEAPSKGEYESVVQASRVLIDSVMSETGLPATDVVRFGAGTIVDAVMDAA